MSAPSSSDDTNKCNRVPDEKCSISGKYQDFSTTVEFSVDSIKERFKEEKVAQFKSHEFKIGDDCFRIIVLIDKGNGKTNDQTSEEWWLGACLYKTESSSSSESTISFKLEFLDTNLKEVRFTGITLKKKSNRGFPCLMNREFIDALPTNSVNLFCTVTLHSKEKDILSTKRSRSSTNLIGEELASYKRNKVGLPTSKDKLFTDFVIESEDGMVIKCHRIFLATHSPVFRAMLESEMKEAKERRLKLDFCGEFLQNAVNFLYDTTLDEEIVLKHYEDFLHLSDKYDIGHLKLQIEDVLIKNLSTDLMTNYYVLGDLYNAKNLKEAARNFMVNNKDCFKKEEFTNQLKKLNPDRIVEIMKLIV